MPNNKFSENDLFLEMILLLLECMLFNIVNRLLQKQTNNKTSLATYFFAIFPIFVNSQKTFFGVY